MTLILDVHKTKIFLSVTDFGKLCILTAYGRTYTNDAPTASYNVNRFVTISSILIDKMRSHKRPLKLKWLKENFHLVHHLVNHVLFTRSENYEQLLKEDVVTMYMMTKNFKLIRHKERCVIY